MRAACLTHRVTDYSSSAYHLEFLKKENSSRKTLSVLDNDPTHPDVKKMKNSDVEAIYLSLNVTAVC